LVLSLPSGLASLFALEHSLLPLEGSLLAPEKFPVLRCRELHS